MSESLNIINQTVQKLIKYNKNSNQSRNKNALCKSIKSTNIYNYLNTKNIKAQNMKSEYTSMEQLINHFKYWSEGFVINSGWTYQAVESPKGEFGVSLMSDNSNKPYKCKVRSPAYHHLQVLPEISKGHFLADLTTLIGTIDIVFGEIDR